MTISEPESEQKTQASVEEVELRYANFGVSTLSLGFSASLRSSFGFFGAGVIKVSLGELQFSRTLLQGFCQGSIGV